MDWNVIDLHDLLTIYPKLPSVGGSSDTHLEGMPRHGAKSSATNSFQNLAGLLPGYGVVMGERLTGYIFFVLMRTLI